LRAAANSNNLPGTDCTPCSSGESPYAEVRLAFRP
jgi:hypothetical protein